MPGEFFNTAIHGSVQILYSNLMLGSSGQPGGAGRSTYELSLSSRREVELPRRTPWSDGTDRRGGRRSGAATRVAVRHDLLCQLVAGPDPDSGVDPANNSDAERLHPATASGKSRVGGRAFQPVGARPLGRGNRTCPPGLSLAGRALAPRRPGTSQGARDGPDARGPSDADRSTCGRQRGFVSRSP